MISCAEYLEEAFYSHWVDFAYLMIVLLIVGLTTFSVFRWLKNEKVELEEETWILLAIGGVIGAIIFFLVGSCAVGAAIKAENPLMDKEAKYYCTDIEKP